MLRTALALAARGMAIFPCRERAKQPATEHGLKDATTNPKTIRQWWQQNPQFNVAIATGAVSKVFALDVDSLDAELALRKLERENSALPSTVEVVTARGRHIYFRWPEMPVRNSTGRIAEGVDVRGANGYCLSPPSIHPDGRRYEWSVDSANAIAAAPGWLLDKIAERTNGNGQAAPPSEWRKIVTGVDEGRRDCTVAKLSGHLLRRFIDPFVVLDLMQCWNAAKCRPPLPEADVTRIVNSICTIELRRRGHAG